MMNKYLPAYFLAIVLLLYSCEAWLPCLEGDGEIVTEDRLGGSFSGIQTEGEFNVRVEYAETTSVEVTADENLMNNIETTVKGDKLVISSNHDGCVNFSSETEVVVKCPNLTHVTQMGSGNLEVFNFSAGHFIISHAGSGNVNISSLSITDDIEVSLISTGNVWLNGRANDALYILSGSGNIDSETMRVFNCTATLSGSGNIHTYVYNLLRVTLTGSGSVYYYGNTKEVVEHITSSGDVVNRASNSTN